MITQNTNISSEALELLLSQFWSSEKLQWFIKAHTDQMQDLENAAVAVLSGRYLDNAAGVQLDNIGEIVDLARGNLTDAQYRARLKAKIRTNRSFGQGDDLLEIAGLVAPSATIALSDEPPAAVRLTAWGLTSEETGALGALLVLAKAAGVRITFVYSYSAPGATFTFAAYGASLPVLGDGTGFDDGALAGAVGA